MLYLIGKTKNILFNLSIKDFGIYASRADGMFEFRLKFKC